MKRFLSSLCLVFALVALLPDCGWSQAYDQTQSPPTPTPRNGRRGRQNSPTPAPAPAASVAATLAPTPPGPAIISGLAPGFVTVTQGAATKTYKVTRYSQISFDGQTCAFSALKVGMGVVITPTSDLIYADAVAATDPPAPPPAPAAPAAPQGEAAPATAQAAPAAAASPAPAPVSPPAQ